MGMVVMDAVRSDPLEGAAVSNADRPTLKRQSREYKSMSERQFRVRGTKMPYAIVLLRVIVGNNAERFRLVPIATIH
jgi:hypothetical protein